VGSRGLESDAWITADGQVVLDHDGVTGMVWRRRPIGVQPRAALPAHIPSLAELYRAVGADFELSLDIKDPATLEPILLAADGVGARDRLWLCHGDRRLLAGWRSEAGSARLVESTAVGRMAGGFETGITAAQAAGLDAVNLHRREWTPGRIEAVHAAGLRAFGWDAQTRAEIIRLLDAGIDGVYSDDAGLLAALIKDRYC
jgi:glycerophosphoryl diester phosphodiesterase